MAEEVSQEIAGVISGSKVFGSSENIRHGKYKMLIKRIFAQKVEIGQGQHKMAFWEMTPIESAPNPQVEGDHVDYPGTSGPLIDDGTKPNPVGSNCALKVDFDGVGGRSAGANIKAAILGLFGKRDGEIPDAQINETWIDLAREKPVKKGEQIGWDPTTKQPILATADKQANPACGMVIYCTTIPKKKKTANEKGAYITKLVWSCVSPPGTGENAPELVAKRRAEIEAARADEEEEATPPPSTPAGNPYAPQTATPQAPAAQPTPPTAPPPPAPVAPTAAAFTPAPPWEKHPSQPVGPTPETRWFWSNPALGGNNAVKNEAQLRAGQ